MKTADYWKVDDGGRLRCLLCPHECRIAEGKSGLCGARVARGGALHALCYGIISSAAMDPVEKKPLYHFYPGRQIFSIGSWGCNLGCEFCQNWTISQAVRADARTTSPQSVVNTAVEAGAVGIAYTYNEPLINIEFVKETCSLSRVAGLANVLVTNGFVNPGPAADLLPLVDALNIDIKSMDESFYRRYCKAELDPVLKFAVQSVRAGCHVEITNLVIPTLNDSDAHFERLAEWISINLGRKVPLHLGGYRPEFKMEIPATESETLERGRAICARSLDRVYVGNVRTPHGQDTSCTKCGAMLIRRSGYEVTITGISDGACVSCGTPTDIKTSRRQRS